MPRRQQALVALIGLTVVVAVVVVIVLTRGQSPSTGTPPTPITTSAPPAPSGTPSGAVTPSVAGGRRVADILADMHRDAFNPTAPSTKGSDLPGGLYINWIGTWDGNPATAIDNTNLQDNGEADAASGATPRHDPVTDLMYMRNLAAYQAAFPTDTRFSSDATRMEPIVKAEFAEYTYYRSWIYFQFRELDQLQPGAGWDQIAHHFVEAVFKDFYKSGVGTIEDTPDHKDSYRTDFAAQSAAAFADAGARYGEPALSAAAASTAAHLLAQAQNPSTHLFPLQMTISSGGDTVLQAQVTVGEEAQLLDSLLTVYDHLRQPQILTAVQNAVNGMYSPQLGLADPTHGGFFHAVNADGTGLDTAYKETRQSWMVQTLTHLNQDAGGQADRIAAMTTVVIDDLWQSALDGYIYRTTPAFGVWTNHDGPDRAAVQEDFVTSESMGIAGNVLLP